MIKATLFCLSIQDKGVLRRWTGHKCFIGCIHDILKKGLGVGRDGCNVWRRGGAQKHFCRGAW